MSGHEPKYDDSAGEDGGVEDLLAEVPSGHSAVRPR